MTSYEVWYNNNYDLSTAIQSGGDITGTTHTITSLNVGTKYYIWLRSKDLEETSGFSTVVMGTPGLRVTYTAEGNHVGTVPVDSNYYSSGSPVTVPWNPGNLNRPGYLFGGWNTAQDRSGTSYPENATFNIGSDHVTLYAQWGNVFIAGRDGSDQVCWVNSLPSMSGFSCSTMIPIVLGQLTTRHTVAAYQNEIYVNTNY